MNYTYKLTTRGLCSELNSLLGFYESVTDKDCRIYIDASQSQQFIGTETSNIFRYIKNQCVTDVKFISLD